MNIYTDTILFILSGACALFAALSVGYLVVSQKRSKVYRDVLRQETEAFDALTTTALLTKGTNTVSADKNSTELLYDGKPRSLPMRNLQTSFFIMTARKYCMGNSRRLSTSMLPLWKAGIS